MTTRPTVEPAGVTRYFAPSLHNDEYAARCESGLMNSAPPEVVLASDHETAIARLTAENKEMRQWWPSARLADLVTERDEARQQLAEMRGKLEPHSKWLHLAAERLQKQQRDYSIASTCEEAADAIDAALAPTSQPSRGKCEPDERDVFAEKEFWTG